MYNILVVEDEEIQASLLRDMIEHEGGDMFHVDIVPDLHTAKIMLLKGYYGAVSLDLNLGDSRGAKTYKAIRALTSANIVVYSGAEDAVRATRKVLENDDTIIFKGDGPREAVRNLVEQLMFGAMNGAAG